MHFEYVLSQLVNKANSRLSDIKLLAEAERNDLLEKFNNTKAKYPGDKTLVDLFEKQVALHPDAIAIEFQQEKLSYRALNEKSNQLADYLRKNYQIKPDDLIGIMADRSERMIIAILAILKSGAGYVPIDPSYPAERIHYILQDSSLKVLLTDTQTSLITGVDLKDLLEETKAYSGSNLKKINQSGNIIYVIYTSGSTGVPKGCLLTHNNVVNYISWANEYYFSNNTLGNFPLFTSLAFDLTVTSIFCPLLLGKTLFICDPEKLIQETLKQIFSDKSNVDVVKITPAHISLLEYMEIEATNVRMVIVGGEELTRHQAEIVRSIHPEITVINEYGPTEATVGCIAQKISLSDTKVLIGKPIFNTQAYILDSSLRILPIGVAGEICISGQGLAKGYLNNDILTNEKFVDHPYRPGKKLYRTGDIGKWCSDGSIEFLGRKDHQVKIRGYRIELGEIENIMLMLPEIKEAAVVVQKDKKDDVFLVGYYVSDTTISEEVMKAHLSNHLPPYMIPSCFMVMEAFPLTTHGKVNKKALPNPEMLVKEGYAEPISMIEQKLVAIWQEVLGKEKIGTKDNFFDLGGHSLKAVQLVSRISKELNDTIDLDSIFSYPTIQGLSQQIQANEKLVYEPISALPTAAYYEASYAQKRLWTLSHIAEGAYTMSGKFTYDGKLDIAIFNKVVSAIIDRHEILRTTFTTVEGEVKQIVHPAAAFDFQVTYVDSTNRSSQELIAEIIESELHIKFDLIKGPLFSIKIIQEDDEKFLCIFSIHHIIFDGLSIDILKNEIAQLYKAYATGKENSLLPLSIQYKDFVHWQNKNISASNYKDRIYWQNKLSGELPILNLPVSKTRENRQIGVAGYLDFTIGETATQRLKKFALRKGVTLYATLVSLIKVLLHAYTKQDDIIVGTPVSGRNHKDLEGQLGLYLNYLALRDQLHQEEYFDDFLKRVHQTILEAMAHQLYPYDKLVEDLDVKKNKNRNFLYDVLVVMNASDPVAEVAQENTAGNDFIIHEFTAINDRSSKVDLSFFFTDNDNELAISVEYRVDLFETEAIEKMAADFKRLIELLTQPQKVTIAALKDAITDREKISLQNTLKAQAIEVLEDDF